MIKVFNFLILLFITLYSFAGNKVIAISYFDNTTSNSKYNSLSKGIADMLITDLSKVSDIDIVEREKLEELLKEIKLGKSSYFDQSTAQKLGKGLGAASILTGAFYVLDNTIRIDARLINVETGKIIAADEVTGSTKDFFSLHKQLVNLLVKSLSIKYNSKTESVVDYNNKIELTAVVNYSNAISYEDNGLESSATEVLESTIKQYPEFLFAQTKLDKIRAFIAEKENEREILLAEELKNLMSNFDIESETLFTETMSIWTNMLMKQNYSSVLVFNKKLKKYKEIIDKPITIGSTTTFGEYIDYYDCLSLYSLKKHDLTIKKSKEFLTKYPKSNYFPSVKNNLTTLVKELENIEKGKKIINELLEFSEISEYVDFFDNLYFKRKFITGKVYEKLKKDYTQKIINGNINYLKILVEDNEYDDIVAFFEIAEHNNDRDLMVTIKDFSYKITKGTDEEEEPYDLEEKIEKFDNNKEEYKSKKEKSQAALISGDINKISHEISFMFSNIDKKDVDFIVDFNTKYLNQEDTRDTWKVYSTRVRAYRNIIRALERSGDFVKMKTLIDQFNNDEFLLQNKEKDFSSYKRDFEKNLKEGIKDDEDFKKEILGFDINEELLKRKVNIYTENYQYFDEISTRKELIEKYELNNQEKENHHLLLFFAYMKVGLFNEMQKCGNEYLKLYSESENIDTIKSFLKNSPR